MFSIGKSIFGRIKQMACHHYRIGRDILLCPSKYHYLSARILVRRSFNSRSFSTAPPIPSNGCLLVVGAGDSTGSAIARRFARSGFDVCLARRNGNKLANVVEEINCERASSSGATHGRAFAYSLDARDEADVQRVVEDVEMNVGPIACCVHNIGANVRFPIAETTARVYRKVWEMAAFSAFLVGKEVSTRMLQRGHGGTILFTGATASVRGGSGFSAFSGAKHAKRALAQSMARELGSQGIHVAHIGRFPHVIFYAIINILQKAGETGDGSLFLVVCSFDLVYAKCLL